MHVLRVIPSLALLVLFALNIPLPGEQPNADVDEKIGAITRDSSRTPAEKAARLEALRQDCDMAAPGFFSYNLINELRHWSDVSGDTKRVAECYDLILGHCPDDGYMNSILSGWNAERTGTVFTFKHPEEALKRYQGFLETSAHLAFLKTVCLMRIGELRKSEGRFSEALHAFREAREIPELRESSIGKQYQRRIDFLIDGVRAEAESPAGRRSEGMLPRASGSRSGPFEVPVLVVRYFPVRGDRIDIGVTGDWGESLDFTRAKTEQLTKELEDALEKGSTYHGYKNPDAKPSLEYKIVGTLEYLEPLPLLDRSGGGVPLPDYYAIMERADIRDWVMNRGVKEVWLWAYHGGVIGLFESNMSSPRGDVSNSSRDPFDLPVLPRSYTVYHYNYQRGASEAAEDHMHQIEAVFNSVDGRDAAPPEKWADLLFWGKFVGSDRSHKIVNPGCGWSHYPPNAERDYDWANPRVVMSDIEDWKPDGGGKKKPICSDRWERDSLKWFIFWMQNMPGRDNGLTFEGKPLTNWWEFIGDYDGAMDSGRKLLEK